MFVIKGSNEFIAKISRYQASAFYLDSLVDLKSLFGFVEGKCYYLVGVVYEIEYYLAIKGK